MFWWPTGRWSDPPQSIGSLLAGKQIGVSLDKDVCLLLHKIILAIVLPRFITESKCSEQTSECMLTNVYKVLLKAGVFNDFGMKRELF